MTPGTLAKVRSVGCDPALVALIGCAAKLAISSPRIVKLLLGSDGMVYGKQEGETTFSLLLGDWSQIVGAIYALAAAAKLSEAETWEVIDAIVSVMDHEPPVAVRLPRCPGRARFTES